MRSASTLISAVATIANLVKLDLARNNINETAAARIGEFFELSNSLCAHSIESRQFCRESHRRGCVVTRLRLRRCELDLSWNCLSNGRGSESLKIGLQVSTASTPAVPSVPYQYPRSTPAPTVPPLSNGRGSESLKIGLQVSTLSTHPAGGR